MNILYLEDRSSVFQPLKEKLESKGHKIYKAIQISDAIGIINQYKIEFLLIDLRVSPIGLNPDEIKKSQSGRISGWLFLQNYAFKKNRTFRKRTVVFSEYIYELERFIDLKEYPDVAFFSKKDSSIEKVFNYILSISTK